ncbi:MAG TPA: hypothetical protein VGU27_10280, partial [Candidatus Eisenbacteria bacterium]|nr:hypothetical protein [Candidatus Eisenbacteria bacterium]
MLATLAYRTADFAAGVLPPRTAAGLARALARGAFALRPPARRAAEANLQRLLPGASGAERTALAREAFAHFALTLVDFLRLRRLPRAALLDAFEIRGREHLEAARAGGRGVIVLSAHLGCWEWGAAWLGASGVPLRLAARAHERGVERL